MPDQIDDLQRIVRRLPEIRAMAESIGAARLCRLLERAEFSAVRRLRELLVERRH